MRAARFRTALLGAALAAATAFAAAPARAAEAAASDKAAALHQAAALYHQGRFDSARVRLEALLAAGPWRRRDSLVLHQYLGMTSAREGAEAAAVARFRDLLALDSLFRFPRNEDPAVLRAFEAARRERAAPAAVPAPAQAQPAPAAPPAASSALAASADAPSAAPIRVPGPSPEDPLRALGPSADGRRRPMSLALGAVPLGGGWLARSRTGHGVTLGLLQAGGILLSLYASDVQSRSQDDAFGIEAHERDRLVRWQWVQRISLSAAVGAYLYSMIAAGGD